MRSVLKQNHSDGMARLGQWSPPQELLEVTGGDRALIWEFYELFRNDTTTRLGVLRHAVITGEVAAIRAQAHALKGSAAQFGAQSIADGCLRMEKAEANNCSAGTYAALMDELDREFNSFLGEVPGNP